MADPETVRVEFYAGYKADQEPRTITRGGKRRRVTEIVDRWHDPAALYFKVQADDGHQYLLRHDTDSDEWTIVKTTPSDA